LFELGVIFCPNSSVKNNFSINTESLPKADVSFGLDMKGETKPPPAVKRGGELILDHISIL